MKRLSQIWLLLFIFYSVYSFGQKRYYKFEQLSLEQGLSQSVINCILQDSYGYLWFGTQDGLNRYDGYSFKRYKHDPTDTTSISGNWIYSITEDREGNLWIGTRSGLNKFNRFDNTFNRFFHDPGNKNSLSDNYIHGVFVDIGGNLWIKATDALSRYDINKESFEHFTYFVDPLNSYSRNRSFPILQDEKGFIWFGTPDGLNYVDPETNLIHRIYKNGGNNSSISDNYITALAFYNDSLLLIGTSNGLNLYNTYTKKIEKTFFHSGKHNSISNNSITSICLDYQSKVWIGTDEGLNCLNLATNVIDNYSYNIDDQEGLGNDIVLSIYEDLSQNLWIGTEGGGINKIDLKPSRFNIIRKSSSENSVPISNNQINSILIDDFDNLWIGTYGYGLNIVNRKTNKVSIYTNSSSPQKLHDNWIHALCEDSRGLIWIGTKQGINIYHQSRKRFYDLKDFYSFTANLEFNNNRVYMIIEDSYRNMWISTDFGLYRINWFTEEVKIIPLGASSANSNTTVNKVFSLLEDSDGFVWIGTVNGLVKYDPKINRYFTYKSRIDVKNSISHNTIYSIYEDSEGLIWIGTISGLNIFNKTRNEFSIIGEKDGLPNNVIYSIQEDDFGFIWVSTDRGLAQIDKKSLQIRSFDIDDGIQGYEFNFGASYKSDNGELFFGGQNGINNFFSDSVYIHKFHPPIVFNGIEILSSSNPRYINAEEDVGITLSHKDFHFNIEFASLDFSNPKRNMFKYQMIGLGEEWVEIGNQNFVSFSNLQAGEYIFNLMGTNSDGLWSEEQISINILIKPPFWKTNLAFTFYIIAIVLLIYSYIEFRTKSLKLSNQILREKQLAAQEISRQKEELSRKNKNITDSINYAKRIQQALFPSEAKLKSLLPNSFVLHKPKDIVSGDFFWIAESNSKIFLSAVDCTGHGVPGAFMSIIGFDLLRNITMNQGLEKPSEILNYLNIGIVEALAKNEKEKVISDGMDLALCVIDKQEKFMEFAGAMNSIYIVRDEKIFEVPGNRFPIGVSHEQENVELFKNNKIEIKPGDKYYIFTDGYADQFGGPDMKKMKFRKFRHNILTFSGLPFEEQKIKLVEQFDKWKGNIEQIDDVLVIGFNLEEV